MRAWLNYLLLGTMFFFIFYQYDLTWFNTHMARDFARAQDLLALKNIPWLGPEMGWDYKRLPGPIYYYFLSFLLLFKAVAALFFLKALFIVGCIALLVRELKAKHSEAILTFSLFFFLTPLFVFTARNFWNPSLIVAFNCLQLSLFLKFERTNVKKNLFLLFAIAALGVQVHFSILLLYLSISLTILLNRQFSNSTKKTQTGFLGLIAIYLLCWYKLNEVPELNDQLRAIYGYNTNLTARVFDLMSFFSLSFRPLYDYDLFSMLTHSLHEMGEFNYNLYSYISFAISGVIFVLLVACLIKIKKNNTVLNSLFAIHFCLFLISILLLKNKEHVPYRYGLCLFPLQFLFLAIDVPLLFKSAKKYFTFFVLFIFIFYGFFNFNIIKAQQMLGRSYHTSNDNLELTLRNKIKIYQSLTPQGGDPLNNLHGRTVNKFRLKEMNWLQNETYYAIYQLVTNEKVKFEPGQSDQAVNSAQLLQLKNYNALKKDYSETYTITKLNPETDLPQNLSIEYYDFQDHVVAKKEWRNTNLIMPFAFIEPTLNISRIQLRFSISNKTEVPRYLNLLVDDNSQFKSTYRVIYENPELKINNVPAVEMTKFTGFFLVQDQYIYKISRPQNSFVLNLKVNSFYQNYSRVDLFVTGSPLEQEELF